MNCQVHSATAGPPNRPRLSKENFGHNEREKCGKGRRGKMATGANLPRGHMHKQVPTGHILHWGVKSSFFDLQECFDNISLGCLHSWSASPASHNTVKHTHKFKVSRFNSPLGTTIAMTQSHGPGREFPPGRQLCSVSASFAFNILLSSSLPTRLLRRK